MSEWNVPSRYCLIALHHHEPAQGDEDLLNVVRFVDALCAFVGVGSETSPVHPDDLPEPERLGLTTLQTAQLQVLIDEVLDRQAA
jgi:hypothetical protein